MKNMKYFEKGNTMNEFRYFNFKNQNMCYDYYQKFAKSLIECLQPINNEYNRKTTKQLNFNYFWDDCVNAGSIEIKDLDIIRVNEGTILKLYNLFYKLNTRMNIIELSSETKLRTELNTTIFYKNSKSDDEEIKSEMVLSDNSIINNVAEYMAMFAIKWIIAHEIGHAFNGHTKYYLEIRKKLDGEVNEDTKEQLFLDLQTMEMDADTFAINRIIDVVMDLYKKNDKILSILKNQKDLLKLVVFSIHGVFYLFRDSDLYTSTKIEHPPTAIRECFVIDSMKEALLKNYKFKVDHQYLVKDIGKIEKFICQVDGKNNERYIRYIENFYSQINEYIKKIQDNFKNNIIYKIKGEARLPIEGIHY